MGMSKGSKWKRAFVHEDAALIDKVCEQLSAHKVTFTTQGHPITNGHPRFVRQETWIMVSLEDHALAVSVIDEFNAGAR